MIVRIGSGFSLKALFARLEAWWLGIDEYYRCIAPLVVANCVVFGLWRVPRLSRMMNRYFICKPGQSSVVSLCVQSSASFHPAEHLLSPAVLAHRL